MTQLTAPRFHHAPMRALGLSIVFAGAVVAAAVLAQQMAPSERQTSVAAAPAIAIPAAGEIPHQVAPLQGLNEVTTPAVTGGVPHQVAPLEGQTIFITDPAVAPVGGELPHQVAPLQGLYEVNVPPMAGEIPHQAAPLGGLDD